MPRSAPLPQAPTGLSRRRLLKLGLGAAALAGIGSQWAPISAFAKEVDDFIRGPAVPDIAPQRLSEHVWMIWSKDGFPTPENQGMMPNRVIPSTMATAERTPAVAIFFAGRTAIGLPPPRKSIASSQFSVIVLPNSPS